MKKITLLSLAVMVLAACSKEDGGEVAEQQELCLTSTIKAAPVSISPTTRGNVQSTQIVENETVWAWISDADKNGAESELYKAEKLMAGAAGVLSGIMTMYFPQTGSKVNIRALHGTFSASAIVEGTTAFPASVDFTVEGDQRAGGDAYVKSDLLYAVADGVAPNGNPTTVPLTFYHMLSKLELVIEKASEITDNIISVTIDEVALSGTFTPKAGADLTRQSERAAMIVASEQTGKMILGTMLNNDGATNDAIVVPQDIGGKKMTVVLSGGTRLIYIFPDDWKFESGKRFVYKVALKGKKLLVTSSIEPWDDSEEENMGDAINPLPARVGDYFYADGTYSTELNPDKTVIGIVFQTNANRIGQAEKDELKQRGINKPHGLVMSLKKAAEDVLWCEEAEVRNFPELTDCKTEKQCDNDISGLQNYNAVIAYVESNNKLSSYPAFKAVKDYDVVAPDNTTGWFLPSVGQWYDFFFNLGDHLIDWGWNPTEYEENSDYFEWYCNESDLSSLNIYFQSADGEEFTISNTNFWSSSEGSNGYILTKCLIVHDNDSDSDFEKLRFGSIKNSTGGVRPILAF